jgi:predicted Zn-dependent protease
LGNPYEYSFVVVDSSTVNAFALPAGRVFITTPLLASVETEAELAGVLGHEIGHIESHHVAKRILARKNSRSQSWLYGTGGAVAGGLIGEVGSSFLCGGNSICVQQLVALAAASGVGVGLLIQKHQFMANSQENELEADRMGFHLSQKAGFSAEHVGDFYRRLNQIWQDSQNKKTLIQAALFDNLSTHPPSIARVQQMDHLIAQVPNPRKGYVTSQEFEMARKLAASLGSNRGA